MRAGPTGAAPLGANPLARKFEHFALLSRDEWRMLDGLCAERVRRHEARADILREGDKPHAVNLILQGWACRYRVLRSGKRQIIALMLPGDLCDHDVVTLREMDHSVATLSPVTLAEVSRERLAEVARASARLDRALAWDTLVTMATQREWTVNLGLRDAFARLAHLFCEVHLRLRALGLVEANREGANESEAEGGSCDLPLTQVELAEATGMTSVHVNRTLQDLRKRDLVELQRRRLMIPDLAALCAAAEFNPGYLHLGREGAHLDASEAERA